jgi:erythromycin esterase-like protein
MLSTPEQTLLREGQRLSGAEDDYDALLELVGEAEVVLLGEASHGTHEFYRERARITRRLIEELGFRGVAVEADWPDAYRVNRYVHGAGEDADAEEALRGFRRFPTWMWRNAEVLDFVGWLGAHNERNPERPASFYGLDLYSLYASAKEVISYLERIDPPAAGRARERYACFEPFPGEQVYGRAVVLGISESCERGAIAQLAELQRLAEAYLRRDGVAAEDEQFYAEQNARLVASAEGYYRSTARPPRRSPRRGWSGRSASSTGPRPSATATTSSPTSPASSTPRRPPRRDARGGAAGAHRGLGSGRAAGDVPDRPLRESPR